MRPTPSETIARIRTILKDVVEPEVHSEHARSRLREIRAVLAQIDWDDALPHLRRRTEGVRALLDDITAWIEADPARAAGLGDLRARISPPDHHPAADSFAELNERYAAEAALLTEAGDALAAWSREHDAAGDEASGRYLRLRILRQLAA